MSAQKNDKPEEPKPAAAASPEAKPAEGAAAEAAKHSWQEQVKKFAFAAVGAVNLSQDDVKTFVGKLVEKGEIAKKDGEKIIKSFAEKVQQTVKRDGKAAVAKAEGAVETVSSEANAIADKASAALNQEKLAEKINASIERVLHSMNIATRKDVEELGKQLDELDKKFAQLVEAAGSAGRARKQPSPNSTVS